MSDKLTQGALYAIVARASVIRERIDASGELPASAYYEPMLDDLHALLSHIAAQDAELDVAQFHIGALQAAAFAEAAALAVAQWGGGDE